ncbi:MAG: TadE/TadG family type IV pilus assembly protein [Ktedonobacteraceae bacterium]
MSTTNAHGRAGQSMIEFALSMPFLMLILVAVVFFGRYFTVAQVMLNAAQEGAKVASRTANLSDEETRDLVRGFTTTGGGVNPNSVIYRALGSARLLSQQTTGDLPPGSSVLIMPFDQDDGTTPPGAVSVKISYPFQLLGNPFQGASKNVAINMSLGKNQSFVFPNFTIVQQAVAADEIYQAPVN